MHRSRALTGLLTLVATFAIAAAVSRAQHPMHGTPDEWKFTLPKGDPAKGCEFFAESIINPSAVIDKGRGDEAADGSSKMPSFNDSMSVQELADFVAYLQALKPPGGAPTAHDGHGH